MKEAQRAVSVSDIAALAGVSPGTVSNVMNWPHRVRGTTRQKVEAAMVEAGFVRNESARQLRAGQSRVTAYVVLNASNPFFTDVALGIEDVVEAVDLSLFTCNSHQDPSRQAEYLRRLEQQRVRGVFITPIGGDDQLIDELPARGTPVVLVDERSTNGTHCSVTVDDRLGGRLAVEHLIELGHSRIAFVGGPMNVRQVRDRLDGAQDIAREDAAGAPVLVEIRTDALEAEEGRRAAARIAKMPPRERPTAAFCANDLLALGLLQGCVELDLAVPDQLAIVGYDDIEFAAAAAVPLTSVRRPRREMGRAAARLLLDEVNSPHHHHQQLMFTPDLVARASTGGTR